MVGDRSKQLAALRSSIASGQVPSEKMLGRNFGFLQCKVLQERITEELECNCVVVFIFRNCVLLPELVAN